MPHDRLYLQDILDAADAIASFIQGTTPEQFAASDLLRSAVLQKLIIIGEAAGQISARAKNATPDVPWQRIVAFRNLAVHRYFRINWAIVWTTATVDAPQLREQIVNVLASGGFGDKP